MARVEIVCKVQKCPFRSKNGFCRQKVLRINQNGTCGHVYIWNGSINQDWNAPVEEKYMNDFKEEQENENRDNRTQE